MNTRMKKYSLEEYMALVKSKINDGMYDRTKLLSSLLEAYLIKLEHEKSKRKQHDQWLFEIAKYEKLARQLHQLLTKKPADERIRKTGLYLFARDINRHDRMPSIIRHLKYFRARTNTPIVNKNGFGALITAFLSYTVYREQLTDELACELGLEHPWRSAQQHLIRETLNNLLSIYSNSESEIDLISYNDYLESASRLESAMSELDRERLLEAICQIIRLSATNGNVDLIHYKLMGMISRGSLAFTFNDKHMRKLLEVCMDLINLSRTTEIAHLGDLFDVMLQFQSQLTSAQKKSLVSYLLACALSNDRDEKDFAAHRMCNSMCDIVSNAELSQMLVLMSRRKKEVETLLTIHSVTYAYNTILIKQVLRRPKSKLRQAHIDLVIKYIFHDDERIVTQAIQAIKQLQSVVALDLISIGFDKISDTEIFGDMLSMTERNSQKANLAEFMTLFDLISQHKRDVIIETAISHLKSYEYYRDDVCEVLANLYRIADADQRTKIRFAINIAMDGVIANFNKTSRNFITSPDSFSNAIDELNSMLQYLRELITEVKIIEIVGSAMGVLTKLIDYVSQSTDFGYIIIIPHHSECLKDLCQILGFAARSISDGLRSQVIKTLSDLVFKKNLSGKAFAMNTAMSALVHYRYAMTEAECDVLINNLNEYSRSTDTRSYPAFSISHNNPLDAYILLIDFISDRTRKDAILCMMATKGFHLPQKTDFFKTCNNDVRLIEIINLLNDQISRAPSSIAIDLYQAAVSRYNELSALSMIKNKKNLPEDMMKEVTRHGLGVTSTR